MDKSQDSVHKPQPFRRERRAEAEAVSNRGPSAYQPNALPLGQTGSRPSSSSQREEQHSKKKKKKNSHGLAFKPDKLHQFDRNCVRITPQPRGYYRDGVDGING